MSVENVIICYGNKLGYHHGAKYQMLRMLKNKKTNQYFCVVTDKPELFHSYPCRICEIDIQKKQNWSLGGLNHFGIKIMALHWAAVTCTQKKVILLDTDMYWKKCPEAVTRMIDESTFLLYENEGAIYGSKNLSHQRFEQGLDSKNFYLSNHGDYKISKTSEMWRSSIIGFEIQNASLLLDVFELFSLLDPHVHAHTVEQFALGEILRLLKIHKLEGKKHVSDWSSIGRKDYATQQLEQFFLKYGEHNFKKHLKRIDEIKIKRPFSVILKQKFERLKR